MTTDNMRSQYDADPVEKKDWYIEAQAAKEKARIADLVDSFMGDVDSENDIMEIVGNNEDCYEATMNLCSIRTPHEMIGRYTLDETTRLARAAIQFIKAVEEHAKGYVEVKQ